MYFDHQDIHLLTPSFPTLRLADLFRGAIGRRQDHSWPSLSEPLHRRRARAPFRLLRNARTAPSEGQGAQYRSAFQRAGHHLAPFAGTSARQVGGARSEEHTSELQSLMRISYAVFCLKKKQTKTTNTLLLQIVT